MHALCVYEWKANGWLISAVHDVWRLSFESFSSTKMMKSFFNSLVRHACIVVRRARNSRLYIRLAHC